MGRHGLDCSGSEQGKVAGAYECSSEISGSIKNIIYWLAKGLVAS
jgi:hypothetical protein